MNSTNAQIIALTQPHFPKYKVCPTLHSAPNLDFHGLLKILNSSKWLLGCCRLPKPQAILSDQLENRQWIWIPQLFVSQVYQLALKECIEGELSIRWSFYKNHPVLDFHCSLYRLTASAWEMVKLNLTPSFFFQYFLFYFSFCLLAKTHTM